MKYQIGIGTKQAEAVALYEKAGYRRIKNFGPFVDDTDSICIIKNLYSKR